MFSAKQYRTKAAEFEGLLKNPLLSMNEASEFRNLEQSYTTLAENEEWVAINIGKTILRHGRDRDTRTTLADSEDSFEITP
jgi:hypothetical protein